MSRLQTKVWYKMCTRVMSTLDRIMFCVVPKLPESSRTCISLFDVNRSFHIESWKRKQVLMLYQHNQPNRKWCKVIILIASILPCCFTQHREWWEVLHFKRKWINADISLREYKVLTALSPHLRGFITGNLSTTCCTTATCGEKKNKKQWYHS